MSNPDLPDRTPFVGPPIPWPVDRRADVIERCRNALRGWTPTEPTSTQQRDSRD